jgi:hypothetical protein
LLNKIGRTVTSRSGNANTFLKVASIEEIAKTHADRRSAPPMVITDAYGASACENAIRIQENPPNGKTLRNSSITSRAGMNQKMFWVYLPRKPRGR